MKVRNLTDLFIHQLTTVHNAETLQAKSLPRMAERARNKHLKSVLNGHCAETERHITRIHEVMDILGLQHKPGPVPAMEGLLADGENLQDDIADDRAVDATLIAAAQKIEHYEIACYGTLIALARALGYDNAVVILKETLEEEKNTDVMLTHIATDEGVNRMALKRAA